MPSREIIIAIIVALGLWGTVWSVNKPSLTPDERLLFSMLDASISQQPPQSKDIVAAFDLPANCRGKACFFDAGTIGGLRYTGGNLWHSANGLVFVVEGFSNSCIRASRVRSHFGAGEAKQSCFDAVCWYAGSQRSWGMITFQLAKPDSQCVSSAVINSQPEHRPN